MTDELRRFTRYGEKKAGTNNKFYEVEALEREDGTAEWIFRWGRIGTEGQSKEGTSYSFESAKRKCEDQFKAKAGRGYRQVTAMEALASACQDVAERKTNGHEAVDLVIPKFWGGASEKRCQEFCRKWNEKLNVVRKSRWDLGDAAYRTQIVSVLEGYCKEWKRILGTKAHGHLADNAQAHTAFRMFFSQLKDNAKLTVCGHFEGVGTVW